MNTPLKYTHTTTRALSEIRKKIPAGSVIDSYLLFSGDLELSLSDYDMFVCAHTNKYVIYEFWLTLLEDSRKIHDIVTCEDFKFAEPQFEILQESWAHYKDPYVRSALFFLLNRCSETGEVSSGKLTPQNYNNFALASLATFKKRDNFCLVYDEVDDFVQSIIPSELSDYVLVRAGDFKYNLFEEGISRGDETVIFDHKKLKRKLDSLDKKIAIVYNFHSQLLSMYRDYEVSMINKYGKQTKDKGQCVELLITNF